MRQLLTLILALAAGLCASAQSPAQARLEAFAGRMERFNQLFPQEKVYLHLDNTGYFRGETIWWKAYIRRADTGAGTDLSGVLYVELLNPAGDVVQTCKAQIKDAQADGAISLKDLFVSGFYEIRAYTRYMLNFGEAGVFSRVVPVFDQPEKTGDYSHAVIDELNGTKRVPKDKAGDTTSPTKKLRVAFYPEGGHLVEGLRTRVAFCATRSGAATDATGTLTYPDGRTEQVATLREGRGTFAYTPGPKPATLTLRTTGAKPAERTFYLPAAEKSGVALNVDATGGDNFNVHIATRGDSIGALGLALISGGNLDAFVPIEAAPDGTATLALPRADMAEGVSQIAVISDRGQIMAERMLFVFPDTPKDSLNIDALTRTLRPCGKIELTARTTPGATFSLAVRDQATQACGSEGSVRTWLLLGSELKGYIHNPDYYLESDDQAHRAAADLLMLTQGWRRYDPAQMTGTKPFERRHPLEDHLYVYGQLAKAKKKDSVAGVALSTLLYNRAGNALRGEATTDSVGAYAFRIPDCEGEWTMLMNTKVDDKDRKYKVKIDRNFSPAPRMMWPEETQRLPVAQTKTQMTVIPDFDKYIPMDQQNHLLREVKVKGHRIYDDARAAWESEKNAAYWASTYYDCDKALDQLADNGEDAPEFFPWLVGHGTFFSGNQEGAYAETALDTDIANAAAADAAFAGEQTEPETISTDELTGTDDEIAELKSMLNTDGLGFKNRPIVWILNNQFKMATNVSPSIKSSADLSMVVRNIENMPQMLDEVKSVYISEDPKILMRYAPITALQSSKPVFIFVYTHHEFPVGQKGLRRTHFSGYDKAQTFEMEDYSVLPPMADYRRTLYWAPNIKADDKGQAKIELYNNSTCRQINLSAEGFAPSGQPIAY